MRIAITNWSRRVVGGTEGYIQSLMPALAARGLDVAFWTEHDEPADRDAIEVPQGGSPGALRTAAHGPRSTGCEPGVPT